MPGEPKNEAPFTSPYLKPGATPAPTHVALTPEEHNEQLRAAIVVMANWSLTSLRPFSHYSERPDRLSMFGIKPGDPDHDEILADCASGCTGLYQWGGAPDPNKANFKGASDTGTLYANMAHITIAQVRPADIIFFGPPPFGVHAALALSRISATDFWTWNNGGPTGAPPSRIRYSDTEKWMIDNGHPGVTFLSSLP